MEWYKVKHENDIILTSSDTTWLVLAVSGENLHELFILSSWRHQGWWTNREYHRRRECTTRCFLSTGGPHGTPRDGRSLPFYYLGSWCPFSLLLTPFTKWTGSSGWMRKLHFILTCKMKRTRGKRKKGLINSFPHNNSSPLHLTL